jgi:hypothetical protein
MDRLERLAIAAAAIAILEAGGTAPARAQPSDQTKARAKEECALAYDTTQVLRRQGKLISARQHAAACSVPACSVYVTRDCTQWYAEIDAILPTVVLAAKDATGADATAVRVTVDGQVFAEQLDGKGAPIDPGEHVVRFEMAGAAPIEQRVLIREGEKNRALSASFPPRTVDPLRQPPPAKLDDRRRTSPGSPRRTLGFIGIGAGAAGLVVGTVAGGLVIAQYRTLAPGCPEGHCPPSERASVDRYNLTANVANAALAIGGALALIGIVLVVTAPKAGSSGAARWAPVIGRAFAGAEGAF